MADELETRVPPRAPARPPERPTPPPRQNPPPRPEESKPADVENKEEVKTETNDNIGENQESSAPTKKTKKSKNSVEDSNLNVVETALSVEELNQRKQRRVRNATIAMAAVVAILAIVLIVIIFWPTEEKVEAEYDLTFTNVPSVAVVEHSIYSSEVSGSIVSFKKPITIQNPSSSSFSGFTSFVMEVSFKNSVGRDVTDQFYLRLSDAHSQDIYNLENIKSITLGELENVPSHQIYVDMSANKYIYYNNVLAQGEDAYPVLLGFLCKDSSLLQNELTMQVKIYGFNADGLQLVTTQSGTNVRTSDGTLIPATEEWVTNVKHNLEVRN